MPSAAAPAYFAPRMTSVGTIMAPRLYKFLQLVAMPLPQGLKRQFFRHVLGWSVASDAYVGFSYMGTEHATLEAGSHIGHFNVIRNMVSVHFGRNTYMKDFNQMFGTTPPGEEGARTFYLGEESHIMSRHFFEVGGAIKMGRHTLLAGRGSQIYTHSLVTLDGIDRWKVSEVNIGEGAKIYASAILVHCNIPRGAIVAAGAVLTKSYESQGDERLLIAGNPAVVVGTRGIWRPPPREP